MFQFNFNKILKVVFVFTMLSSQAAFAQLDIMPLGDSVTKGLTGSTVPGGYRDDLAALLDAALINYNFVGTESDGTGFDADHQGQNGLTTTDIIASIDGWLTLNSPDVVLLHIGTNDISADRNGADIIADIETIIDKILTNDSSTRIILSTLIPRLDAQDASTDALNLAIANTVSQRSSQGVDITLSDPNSTIKANPSWMTQHMFDDLHPNDSGYAILSQSYFDAINNTGENDLVFIEEFDDQGQFDLNWTVGPEFALSGGVLDNTIGTTTWLLAVFKKFTNAQEVTMVYAPSADATGIRQSGMALKLSDETTAANGYLVRYNATSNAFELFEILAGSPDNLVESRSAGSNPLSAGDTLKVELTSGSSHFFDIFVNNSSVGQLADPLKKYGNEANVYSGVLLRGTYNNNVARFTYRRGSDQDPPGSIPDLSITQSSGSSASLSWTAPAEDGGSGGPVQSYDIRYSISAITDGNFLFATAALNTPTPAFPGFTQTATVTGLAAGTTYFFAVKTRDEVGNISAISNVVSTTTSDLSCNTEDFDGSTFGTNWTLGSQYVITNGEMENTATTGLWNHLAVYNLRTNPLEVSFKFGQGSDADGIAGSGMALMIDENSTTASGYFCYVKNDNTLRLWTYLNGTPGSEIASLASSQPFPTAGGSIKILMSSDISGHHFEFIINNASAGRLTDPSKLQGNGGTLFSGVILRAPRNNNIDDFVSCGAILPAVDLVFGSGNNQSGAVGEALAEPIVIMAVDVNGGAVQGVPIDFQVLAGGGSVAPLVEASNIFRESEAGVVVAPMQVKSDAGASGGQYVIAPNGSGQNGTVTFTFDIPEAGNYKVWGRAKAPSGSDDSFFYSVDGEADASNVWDVHQGIPGSDWRWDEVSRRGTGTGSAPQVPAIQVNFTVGTHTMRFRTRDDGCWLDKILVTSNDNFVPTGTAEGDAPSTNASGQVPATWTLGPNVGTGNNQVQVSSPGFPSLGTELFTASGTPDSAAVITIVSGDLMSGEPGTQLANPFVVELRDQFNNPVGANVDVSFTVTQGNGTMSPAQPVLTDGTSRAQAFLTLATDNPVNKVKVTSPGYTGLDVIFTATATAGDPTTIALEAGNNQNGSAGLPLSSSFQVLVTDALGSLVVGHDVTFSVTNGGGNFSGSSEITVQSSALGVASTILTLGPTPGAINEAQATASFGGSPLTGSPVSFTASSGIPETLSAASSLNQAGTANLPLADSISVRVSDENENVLPGYPVTFEIITDGGFEAGRVNGSTGSVTVNTNSSGLAKVEWRLGGNAGSNNNKLRASSTYNSAPLSGSPIEFTASAAVGAAETMVKISGNNQSNQIETPLDDPFVIEVRDPSGNPVTGWPVTFAVTAGGGNLDGQTSRVVNTDGDGRAIITLTLGSEAGTPGNPFNNSVEASAENNGSALDGSPFVFNASAISTGAENIDAVSALTLSGQAGVQLPQPVQVKITDKNGNPVGSHDVTFSVINGGGHLNGTTETQVQVFSDVNGIASINWYLGGLLAPQVQTLRATSNDGINDLNGSPINFSAKAIAGQVDPDASTVTANPTAVQANGVDKSTITVTLKDIFDNPIADKAVNIISPGTIIEQPGLTNASGLAFGSVASTVAGVKTITARNVTDSIDLNTFAEVTFLTNPPEEVELQGGNNQTSNVGTAVPNPIEILVTDDFNNPVQGITVEFEVTGGGGYIAETSAPVQGSATLAQAEETTTNSDGIAGATWVLGPTPGENTAVARATFNGIIVDAPVVFTATGIQATASLMTMGGGNNQQNVPAGTTTPEPISVKITDSGGKPVSGVTVNFSVEVGGGSVVTQNAVSDPQGLASTAVNLGATVGLNVFNATNASLTGSPISFTITSVIGGPSRLERVSGHDVDASVGAIHVVSAIVADLYGNPLQGQTVNFQIVSGGGNIPNPTQATNVQGIATAQVIMPNATGEVIISAVAAALPTHFVNYTVNAVHGTPTTLLEMSGNNQDGSPGKPLVDDMVVKVTDVFGNPVSDFQIQWVALGGGSFPQSITSTDDAGLAANKMSLGTAVGTYTGLAISSTSILSPSQLSFEASVVENNFPEITGLSDQDVTEGQLLQFGVNATDSDNDPISFEVENLPTGASFNNATGTFSWTPGQTQSVGSPYSVTFIAKDNRGGLDAETIDITVLNANNPPRIASFSPQTLEMPFIKGTNLVFQVTVEDLDNESPAYTWLLFEGPGDDSGELVSTSQSYTMNTSNRDHATYVVQIRVTDGQDADTLRWYIDLITSVDLASFSGNFEGFDGVHISWSTSRETDNTGFDVSRSTSENGTYEKVTSKLIPSSDKGEYSFVDNSAKAGGTYYYRLEDVNINGVRTEHGPISIKITAPEKFELSQNYPNPFNPETKIRYQLPSASLVQIRIFDVLGREVKTLINQDVEAGYHIETWNALNNDGVRVSSGVYYYYIRAGEFKITKKMLLMK